MLIPDNSIAECKIKAEIRTVSKARIYPTQQNHSKMCYSAQNVNSALLLVKYRI